MTVDETLGTKRDGEACQAVRARAPYEAPTVRRLGSVRELTLGTPSSGVEGPGFPAPHV